VDPGKGSGTKGTVNILLDEEAKIKFFEIEEGDEEQQLKDSSSFRIFGKKNRRETKGLNRKKGGYEERYSLKRTLT